MTSRTTALLAGAAGFVFIIATQQAMAQQINVSATVAAECSVTSSATLAFGEYDPAGGNTAQDSFNIQCTSPASADITLNNGQNPNGSSQRQLANENGDKLVYLLYSDQVGGTQWNGDAHSVDVLQGNVDTPVSVFGSLPGSQPAPSGNYTDVVTITVEVTPSS